MHKRYKSWKSGEPNNWQNNEDYAYIGTTTGAEWNDASNNRGNALCYKGLFGASVTYGKFKFYCTKIKFSADCFDSNSNCAYWGSIGECQRNRVYMNQTCKMSCNQCGNQAVKAPRSNLCTDKQQYCNYWARTGECSRNPNYMNANCPKSCNRC